MTLQPELPTRGGPRAELAEAKRARRVGFTATRGMTEKHHAQVRRVLARHAHADEYTTGGAPGGDQFIAEHMRGLNPKAHHRVILPRPQENTKAHHAWARKMRGAYDFVRTKLGPKERNQTILDHTDHLVAFPRHEEHRDRYSGTWATVRMARKRGISHEVHVLEPEVREADTPGQKRALRQNKAARHVRKKFPAGTRVTTGHMNGTVHRHVPGLNAQGGHLVVKWDNGVTGRMSPINVERLHESSVMVEAWAHRRGRRLKKKGQRGHIRVHEMHSGKEVAAFHHVDDLVGYLHQGPQGVSPHIAVQVHGPLHGPHGRALTKREQADLVRRLGEQREAWTRAHTKTAVGTLAQSAASAFVPGYATLPLEHQQHAADLVTHHAGFAIHTVKTGGFKLRKPKVPKFGVISKPTKPVIVEAALLERARRGPLTAAELAERVLAGRRSAAKRRRHAPELATAPQRVLPREPYKKGERVVTAGGGRGVVHRDEDTAKGIVRIKFDGERQARPVELEKVKREVAAPEVHVAETPKLPELEADAERRTRAHDPGDNPDRRKYAAATRGGATVDVEKAPVKEVRGTLVRYQVGNPEDDRWEWGYVHDRQGKHLSVIPFSYRARGGTRVQIETSAVLEAKRPRPGKTTVLGPPRKMKTVHPVTKKPRWRRSPRQVDYEDLVQRTAKRNAPSLKDDVEAIRKGRAPKKRRMTAVSKAERRQEERKPGPTREKLQGLEPGDPITWDSEHGVDDVGMSASQQWLTSQGGEPGEFQIGGRKKRSSALPNRRTGIVISHPDDELLHVYDERNGHHVYVHHSRVVTATNKRKTDPVDLRDRLKNAWTDAQNRGVEFDPVKSRISREQRTDRDRHVTRESAAAYAQAREAAKPRRKRGESDEDYERRVAIGQAVDPTPRPTDVGPREDRGKLISNFEETSGKELSRAHHLRIGDEFQWVDEKGRRRRGTVTEQNRRGRRLTAWDHLAKEEVPVPYHRISHIKHDVRTVRAQRIAGLGKKQTVSRKLERLRAELDKLPMGASNAKKRKELEKRKGELVSAISQEEQSFKPREIKDVDATITDARRDELVAKARADRGRHDRLVYQPVPDDPRKDHELDPSLEPEGPTWFRSSSYVRQHGENFPIGPTESMQDHEEMASGPRAAAKNLSGRDLTEWWRRYRYALGGEEPWFVRTNRAGEYEEPLAEAYIRKSTTGKVVAVRNYKRNPLRKRSTRGETAHKTAKAKLRRGGPRSATARGGPRGREQRQRQIAMRPVSRKQHRREMVRLSHAVARMHHGQTDPAMHYERLRKLPRRTRLAEKHGAVWIAMREDWAKLVQEPELRVRLRQRGVQPGAIEAASGGERGGEIGHAGGDHRMVETSTASAPQSHRLTPDREVHRLLRPKRVFVKQPNKRGTVGARGDLPRTHGVDVHAVAPSDAPDAGRLPDLLQDRQLVGAQSQDEPTGVALPAGDRVDPEAALTVDEASEPVAEGVVHGRSIWLRESWQKFDAERGSRLGKLYPHLSDPVTGARLENVRAGSSTHPMRDTTVTHVSADIHVGKEKVGSLSRFYYADTNTLVRERTSVDESHQGRGIATGLHAAEEQMARAAGVSAIEAVPITDAGKRLSARQGGFGPVGPGQPGRVRKELRESRVWLREDWSTYDEDRRLRSPGRRRVAGATTLAARRVNMHPATPGDRRRLKIPPGWRDVHVHDDPTHHLQAIGIDQAGRSQRRYSAEHHAGRAVEKFGRIMQLQPILPAFDRKLRRDAMQGNEAAKALMLIRRMGLRPGSEEDTKAATKAYGATTLERRHVQVNGNHVRLQFVGKKGVPIDLETHDPEMARVLSGQMEGKADHEQVFPSVSAPALRRYMTSVAPGFHVKDLRTNLATAHAQQLVEAMPHPRNQRELRTQRNQVGDAVAARLGNTRQMALSSYIAPEVFGRWALADNENAFDVAA